MIVLKSEPVVRFEPGKAFPMNAFYTMVGQTYECVRHDSDTLREKGKDADAVLYAFDVALNGYPNEDTAYIDDDKHREFNVRYLDYGKAKVSFDAIGSSVYVTVTNLFDGEYDNSHFYRYAYQDEYSLESLDYYGFVDGSDLFGYDGD